MSFNFLVTIILVSSVAAFTTKVLENQFQDFRTRFDKQYNSAQEEYERYENFVRHIEYLKNRYPNTNNDEIFATLLESGADMSFEEICMRDGTCNIPCEENCPEFEPLVLNYEDVPEQKDWRDTQKVTPAKNQNPCGSCWAFSAIGMLESMVAIQKDVPIGQLDLSEQELADCAHSPQAKNCSHGYWPMSSIEKIVKNYDGKLFGEKLYPWNATLNQVRIEACKINDLKEKDVRAIITKPYILDDKTENGLKTTIATVGPASVALNFTDTFGKWRENSGIYSDSNCVSHRKNNHAVVVVGYGTENGEDYWIIKNSWGEKWGVDGFGKINRNMTDLCGMAMYAITAEVK